MSDNDEKKKSFLSLIPLWTKIVAIVFLVLIVLILFITQTEIGFKLFANIFAGSQIDDIQVTPTPYVEVDAGDVVTVTPTQGVSNDVINDADIEDAGLPQVEVSTDAARSEEYVFSFLVIGEDNMDLETGTRTSTTARADMIKMISVNSKTKRITITSFLRDTLVAIPGYKDNRLSAAYIYGGAELLLETIELNFNIEVDGYVIVGYEAFETLIDGMGGVEITLTSDEANYLNSTNYIYTAKDRCVYAGIQNMTGAQALGYCRIQNVTSKEGLQEDYGRVTRSNDVLTSVFYAYKTNLFLSIFMLDDCLDYVSTSLSREDIIDVLYEVYNENISSIVTLQMPYRSGSSTMYYSSFVREMEVIIPNTLDSNIDILYSYVFGAEN